MKSDTLRAAIKEAGRFLERAKDLENSGHRGGYYDQQVQTAAVWRASLDLTRALADLRRR